MKTTFIPQIQRFPLGCIPSFVVYKVLPLDWFIHNSLRYVVLISFMVCLAASLSAQVQTSWIAHYDYNLPGKVHKPLKTIMDKGGDLVVAGSSSNADGDLDYAAIKYTSSGALVWSYRFNSTAGTNDELRGFVLDDDDNVLLTGTSRTIKLDRYGQKLWTTPYGGRALAVDTNGNTYVTGYSEIDYSTVKLSPTGTNIWERFYDKMGQSDVSQAVAVDTWGNVYVAGVEIDMYWISHGITYYDAEPSLVAYNESGQQLWASVIYPSALTPDKIKILSVIAVKNDKVFIILSNKGYGAYMVAQCDTNGNIIWCKGIVNQVASEVKDFTLSADYIYLCGRYNIGNSTTYHNYYRTYIIDALGNIVWNAAYNGPVTNYHNDTHQANAIAVDKSGCVYVTGISQDASNGFDWATVKYDPQGREVWGQRYDGPAHKRDEALSLVVDDAGNVYVTGTSETKEGGTEIVTIKYSQTTGASIKTSGNALIQYRIDPSQTNHLQTSTNLTDWATLDTLISDALGLCFFEDTNAPIYPHRFYRLTPP